MCKRIANEDTGRVVGTAVIAWGSLTALAAAEGVLAKLPHETILALGAFAFLFSAGTYLLDAQLRRYARTRDARALAAAALLADVALAAALVADLPAAPLVLFVGPLALVLNIAWGERLARAFRSAAPAKSPAGKQAAI
jgi:hypothetical protein